MDRFKIRRLKIEDLENGFFETLENLTTVKPVSLSKAKKIYKKIEKNPVYNIFVAVDEKGKVVGTTTLLIEQKFTRSLSKAGHIEEVVVRKGIEGKGIGTRLIKTVEKEARKKGCYKIVLTTRSEKIADWYKKLGYYSRGEELRKDLV